MKRQERSTWKIERRRKRKLKIGQSHTCEPVASKMLEKFTGELAKKRENFVGLRYVKNVGK